MQFEISQTGLFFIVIGIVSEIIGFIILLKYTQTPRYADYESWKARNENLQSKKQVTMTLRTDPRRDTSEVEPVFYIPIEFLDFWDRERNLGIFCIIGGLFLQLIQLAF